MQSTVFNFGFRLKVSNSQFYIINTSYNFIVFDFNIFLLKSSTVDYAIQSQIRYRDYEDITYFSIDDFCLNHNCNDRFYINGSYGYMNMFALQQDSGFTTIPEYLLRDSLFYNAIVGRLFYFGIFLHNQQRFIVRGNKYLSLFRQEYVRYFSKISKPIVYSEEILTVEYISIPDNNNYLSNSILKTAKFISSARYYKIIENDYREDVVLYYEKMSTNYLYSFAGNFIIKDIKEGLHGITSAVCFSVSYMVVEYFNMDSSYYKYGIITINKKLINTKAYYSKANRITVNKGVL